MLYYGSGYSIRTVSKKTSTMPCVFHSQSAIRVISLHAEPRVLKVKRSKAPEHLLLGFAESGTCCDPAPPSQSSANPNFGVLVQCHFYFYFWPFIFLPKYQSNPPDPFKTHHTMSNQEADWIMPTSMSGSDLSFEDTADLCESSNLSLFNVSSFDGESSDSNGTPLSALPSHRSDECS